MFRYQLNYKLQELSMALYIKSSNIFLYKKCILSRSESETGHAEQESELYLEADYDTPVCIIPITATIRFSKSAFAESTG